MRNFSGTTDEFGLDAVLGSMGLARSTYYYQRAVIKVFMFNVFPTGSAAFSRSVGSWFPT